MGSCSFRVNRGCGVVLCFFFFNQIILCRLFRGGGVVKGRLVDFCAQAGNSLEQFSPSNFEYFLENSSDLVH